MRYLLLVGRRLFPLADYFKKSDMHRTVRIGAFSFGQHIERTLIKTDASPVWAAKLINIILNRPCDDFKIMWFCSVDIFTGIYYTISKHPIVDAFRFGLVEERADV